MITVRCERRYYRNVRDAYQAMRNFERFTGLRGCGLATRTPSDTGEREFGDYYIEVPVLYRGETKFHKGDLVSYHIPGELMGRLVTIAGVVSTEDGGYIYRFNHFPYLAEENEIRLRIL